ncbi:MAG: DUF5615 family PIN-like protein [Gammaproteobacteria bacterium]
MKPPLLANENVPAPTIAALRSWGFDVVAIREVAPSATDLQVLARANTDRRWLVTLDRDYGELVFVRGLPVPPAILLVRQSTGGPEVLADTLAQALDDPSLLEGRFAVFGGRTIRSRPLPAS